MDEEPDPISLGVCGVGQPFQGLKRKAEIPLGSPPEPGQVLQQQDDDGRGGRYKIRVKHIISYWFSSGHKSLVTSERKMYLSKLFLELFYPHLHFSVKINKIFCSILVFFLSIYQTKCATFQL